MLAGGAPHDGKWLAGRAWLARRGFALVQGLVKAVVGLKGVLGLLVVHALLKNGLTGVHGLVDEGLPDLLVEKQVPEGGNFIAPLPSALPRPAGGSPRCPCRVHQPPAASAGCRG